MKNILFIGLGSIGQRHLRNLKKISDPLDNVGESEKKLANDLFETMYNSKGIGLAAVQVGVLKRILVIDVSSKEEKKNPLCFINPIIKKITNFDVGATTSETQGETCKCVNQFNAFLNLPKFDIGLTLHDLQDQ